MKQKVLSLVLAITAAVMLMVVAAPSDVSAKACPYNDISGHWGYDAIMYWSDYGIVNGVGDGRFNPDGDMTRAEAAAVFSRLLNLTDMADISNFTDVQRGSWYEKDIAKAVYYGILQGTGPNTVDPTGKITREQFFTIMVRALGIPEEQTIKRSFSDTAKISGWAKSSCYALINRGWVNGTTPTTIEPQAYITRASVMKVLHNCIPLYITKDGTYKVTGEGVVVIIAKNVALTGDYSSLIAISCKDAVLDMGGNEGTPGIFVLKDGLQIVNGQVDTRVTTAKVANGTTANEDGVDPGTTIYIKAKTVDKFVVTLDGDLAGYGSVALSKTTQTDLDIDTLVTALFTNTPGDNNKDVIVRALSYALDQMKSRTWDYTHNSHEYHAFLDNKGVLSMTKDGEAVNLGEVYLKKASKLHQMRFAEIGTASGMKEAAPVQWQALVDSLDPKSLFTVSGNNLKLLDENSYYTLILGTVERGVALHQALGADFDYEGSFEGFGAWSDRMGLFSGAFTAFGTAFPNGTLYSTVASVVGTDYAEVMEGSPVLSLLLGGSSKRTVLKCDESFANGKDIMTTVNNRTSIDLRYYDVVEYVLNNLTKDSPALGDWSINLTVSKIKE